VRSTNRFLWSGVAVLAGLLLGRAGMTVHAAAPPAAGTIRGKVTYTGTPPKMRSIDMSKEPNCVSQHPTPVMTENVVTGPGNTLRWVVVYIAALDTTSPPSTEAVRYDQKGCEYTPHVQAMQVNQPLDIYNSDPHSHNIHPLARVNPEWNRSQPKGAPPIHIKWEAPEFIPVKCNVHPWMHGYFVVLRTPHYSVTGEDGTFSLAGLPPGKYTVTAWHEQFGSQRQDVSVGSGETKTVSFVFTARPY